MLNHNVASTGEICLDRHMPPEVGPATFDRLAEGCAIAGIELLPAHRASEPAPTQPRPRELWCIGLHIKLLLTSEQGKPLAEARGEIVYGASFTEFYAEEGSLNASQFLLQWINSARPRESSASFHPRAAGDTPFRIRLASRAHF